MERRNFIRLSSFFAGAWLLTDLIPDSLAATDGGDSFHFSPNPLLKIAQSGTVTIYVVKQEMGQNVITALPLILAEELDINPAVVNVEVLPYEQSKAGNYTTWASDSIKSSWLPLRKVGATARLILVQAAAQVWKISTDDCFTKNGKVVNKLSGASFDYKDLVKEASTLTPPEKVKLKDPREFKWLGKAVRKVNVPAIVSGKYTYTMDVKLPGMLYAAVVRCPVYSGKVVSWDSSALSRIPRIVKILQVTQMRDAMNRNGVAIIASNSWAALEGQRLLKVIWDYEVGPISDNAALFEQFEKEMSTGKPAQVFGKDRNAAFQDIDHPEAYKASYQIQYLAHAAIEPMNCTASYQDGKFEIWGGFQAPMYIGSTLPKLFNVKSADIHVNLMPMGGSFGRKEKIDNVADAMQLSRAVEAPVQVIYNRSDDIQCDFFRPASCQRISAVYESGQIKCWRHQLGISTFPGKDISGPWHMLGGVNNDLCYATLDYQSAFYPVESPIPLGSWRSIAFSPNVFAIECFIDELAYHHHLDPIDFRLGLLRNLPDHLRLKAVIAECAEQIGWKKGPARGRYRGFASCVYGHAQAYVAHAIELSVSREKRVTIHRCVAVVDCGLVIDPDGLKAQIEGSLVWALSGVFKNEITVVKGEVQQHGFREYEVLRMNEMPPLEIVLLKGSDSPSGAGEPAVPSFGPALCNALHAATGQRIRELPISKHGFTLGTHG
jgi:isoquinoline 1-oxidoreductase beta subunit